MSVICSQLQALPRKRTKQPPLAHQHARCATELRQSSAQSVSRRPAIQPLLASRDIGRGGTSYCAALTSTTHPPVCSTCAAISSPTSSPPHTHREPTLHHPGNLNIKTNATIRETRLQGKLSCSRKGNVGLKHQRKKVEHTGRSLSLLMWPFAAMKRYCSSGNLKIFVPLSVTATK